MKPIRMMVLSLTGGCNLACRYCYASGQERAVMSWEVAQRAIALAAASGERFVLQLSGGEPLLAFPLLQKIAARVREQQIPARVQLQTNGTLITDEVADFLRTAHFAIGVSLDGRPSENDAQRQLPDGRGAAAAAVAGIKRLAQRGIGIGLTCVVTAENVAQLPGIVEMAYYLGNVRRIGFDLLRGQGRGGNLRAASAAEVTQAMAAVRERAAALRRLTGRAIQFTQVEQAGHIRQTPHSGFAHCYAMNGEGAHVDATGRIYVCSSFVGDERFYIGNVFTGIDEERQQETADYIMRSMEFCRQCEDFSRCGGACFARWAGSGEAGPYAPECALKRAAAAAAEEKG